MATKLHDLQKARGMLDQLAADLRKFDAEQTRIESERDSLQSSLGRLNGDVLRRFEAEDRLSRLDGEIRDLLARRAEPARRAAQLIAILAPAEQQAREAERLRARTVALQQFLEVAALLERVSVELARAREASQGVGGSPTPNAVRALEQVLARWRDRVTPELQNELAAARAFLAEVGAAER